MERSSELGDRADRFDGGRGARRRAARPNRGSVPLAGLASENGAEMWKDIWVPLIIAFFAGAVAAFWPWLQAFQRGLKFQRLIRRELEEIALIPLVP